MKLFAYSDSGRVTLTRLTLALAVLHLLSWGLAAQDTRPAASDSGSAPARPSEGSEAIPARFEATIYQVRVPEDRIVSLDARSLEGRAASPQALEQALAEFGPAKVLHHVNQNVNLIGDRISLIERTPMNLGSHRSASGNLIRSVASQNVGLRIDISAPDAKAGGAKLQLGFSLAAFEDSGVELSPQVWAKSVRNIDLKHSEVLRFGQPRVLLNVSAAAAEAPPLAYVVRYVVSEVKP